MLFSVGYITTITERRCNEWNRSLLRADFQDNAVASASPPSARNRYLLSEPILTPETPMTRSMQSCALTTFILASFVHCLTFTTVSRAETIPDSTFSRFVVELEGGPAWQSRNNVQIPNDQTGTRFSLVDLVGSGPLPAARLYILWNVNERHGLRVLLAPFSYTKSGQFTSSVNFAGETFQPGVPTDATYKFNSWRLSYRYNIYHGTEWRWWIGFTAKLRDAKIGLEQQGRSASKTDLGFVPLLHVAGQVRFGNRWSTVLDVDGLAGGPGRAVDGSLKLRYVLNSSWSVAAGYRTVEGGADVEEVYNFAWFHYATVSVEHQF